MAATLTIEDFERLPSWMVKNHELVDGKLVDVSGNTPLQNLLRDHLMCLLLAWAEHRQRGIVIAEQDYDFLGNAHGPDITFFGNDKRHLLELYKRVQRFVPDLAVEIPSENDTYDAVMSKKNRYLRAGTAEVWLICTDPREIMIYVKDQVRILRPGDMLSSDLLPGFNIAADELFRQTDQFPLTSLPSSKS